MSSQYVPGLDASINNLEPKVPKKLKQQNKIEREVGTTLALIPVIGFIIFGLLPMILAFVMAFLYVPGKGDITSATFVGFENFKEVLTDPMFWQSIKNTFVLAIPLPICIVVSLCVAFLLTKISKGKAFFQAVNFLPYVCCAVAIALMWELIFNQSHGILNSFLGRTRENAIPWLTDSKYYTFSLIIIGIWSGTAFGIVLYGAALTNIKSNLYEAAQIDGANSLQSFFHITLPGVSPTTFYLLITGLIGALQEFTRIQIISGNDAGPNNDGLTIVFYVYRRAFVYNNQMGNASAAALFLVLIISLISAINFIASKKWVKYD